MNSSKEQHLFEIFCNITNVFTATFDQLNASLLKKITNKNVTSPKLLIVVYVITY